MSNFQDNFFSDNFSFIRKKVKLLVVQQGDSMVPTINETIELLNHNYDIESKYAGTVDSAIETMKSWVPTAVLIDFNSPELDVISLLNRWKHSPSSIFVTGEFYSDELARIVRNFGAVDYYSKGENFEQMIKILESIAENARIIQEIH